MSEAPKKAAADNQAQVAKDPAGQPENTTPLSETEKVHQEALEQIRREQEWNKANREKLEAAASR